MTTVRFENTEEDAIAWNMYRVFKTPAARRRYFLLRVTLIPLLALALAVLNFIAYRDQAAYDILPSVLISAGVSLFYGLVLYFGFPTGLKNHTRRLVRQGTFKNLLGPNTVSLEPGGFHVDWSEGSIIRKWSAFQRFAETDTHLILHWGDNEFSQIPKRAFPTPEAQQAFMAEVERLRGANISGVAETATAAVQPASATSSSAWYRDRNSVESESQKVQNRIGGPL